MKDPLALFALCFAAGVLLAGYIEPGLVTLFIIAIPSIYFAYKLHHRGALKASTWLLSTAFLISGLAIAIYEENLYQSREIVSLFRSHRLTSDDTVGLTGVIDSRPEQSPDGYFLTLKLERMRFKGEFSASGKVRLFTPLKNLQSRREFDRLCLIRGTSIDVLVKLNREERHRNPGSNSFLKFLRNKGLDATGTIKSPLLIEPFGQTRQFVLSLWLDDLHHRLLNRIDELFSNPLSGLLKAFLLGNRHYIDRETADRFREGGTLHVIVISGMHISFIAGALILLFRFTGSRRLTQVLGTSLLVTLYTLLVGAEVSIVRASLMFLITSTGYLLFRPIRALNLIGAAVLLILTLSPYTLFDPSFQLTFLSVSLVALSLRVLKRMKETGSWFPSEHMPHPPMSPAWLTVLCETFFWRQKVWRKETSKLSYSYRLYKSPLAERLERYHVQWLLRGLFISLMVTFVVQLGLLPLSVLYFHRFSYASFLLNLFVGMLLGVVSIISLVVLSLSLFTKETGFFIDVAEFLSSVAIHSVDPLKREQIASIRLAEYSAGGGVIYLVYFLTILYIGYLLWTWDPFSRSYRPKRTLIIIFSLTLLLIFYPIRFEEPGRVRVDRFS
jgi:competence protein ComEC